jgi:hypothetical protein
MPAPPGSRRNCPTKAKYMMCRTWFFEIIFTFIPCALLALIIAGMYQYESTSRTFTSEQLYRHAMSPVTIALRAFVDRKLRTLDSVTAFIESGAWPDTADFDPIAMQVLPYFASDSALHSTANVDEIEVAYFTTTDYASTVYSKASTDNFAMSTTTRLYNITAPRVITRDRFVDFGSSGLGYYSPNVSTSPFTAKPWTPTYYTSDVFLPNTVSGKLAFGYRFTALHPPMIVFGSYVRTREPSEFYVAFDVEALFGSILPDCSTGIHTAIYNAGEANKGLIYYNCARTPWQPPASILDVTLLNNAVTPPYPPNTDRPGIQGLTGAGGGLYQLVTVYMNGTDVNGTVQAATEPWQGSVSAAEALSKQVQAQLDMMVSIKSFIATRSTSLEEVDETEQFFASLLIANTYVASIYQLLPNLQGADKTMMQYSLARNAFGSSVFRSQRFDPLGKRKVVTTRNYATDRVTCPAGSNVNDAQACVARDLIETGLTPFIMGYGEKSEVISNFSMLTEIPAWVTNIDPKYTSATAASESSPIFFEPAALTANDVTIVRVAGLPQPDDGRWSNANKPNVALIRLSFDLTELESTLDVLLGNFREQGQLRIVDKDFRLIASAGLRATTDYTDLIRGVFDLVTSSLSQSCTANTDKVICDVTTRTPIVVFYEFSDGPLASETIAVSVLATFNQSINVRSSTLYIVQNLPAKFVTTVSRRDKIVAWGAVFVAVLFLLVNVVYIGYSAWSTVDLKRFMRELATRPASDALDHDQLNLSSNSEIRGIQLALLKMRRATREYAKFLSTGLERGGQQFLEGAEAIDVFEQQKAALFTGAGGARGDTMNFGNGAGDSEMAERPSATVGSVGEAPSGSPSRTYDDILLSHQVGVARREMVVFALDIVDSAKLAKRIGGGSLGSVLTRVAAVFSQQVRTNGGMILPMGSGAGVMCAVWSASRVRNVRQFATVAATNTANVLVATMKRTWLPQKQCQPFQVNIAVAFGNADVGTVGETDGTKTLVFSGEAFDSAKVILRTNTKPMRAAGLAIGGFGAGNDTPPLQGCAVSAAVDVKVAETVGEKTWLLQQPGTNVYHIVGNKNPLPADSPRTHTAEERLITALTTQTRNPAECREILRECTAPILLNQTVPLPIVTYLSN